MSDSPLKDLLVRYVDMGDLSAESLGAAADALGWSHEVRNGVFLAKDPDTGVLMLAATEPSRRGIRPERVPDSERLKPCFTCGALPYRFEKRRAPDPEGRRWERFYDCHLTSPIPHVPIRRDRTPL